MSCVLHPAGCRVRCSAKRGLRTHARMETTALQRKLEAMAQQIGTLSSCQERLTHKHARRETTAL